MPVDEKLENWNKENCPIEAVPRSPDRSVSAKCTQPRIVLKSLEKSKYYTYQSDESGSSHDEDEIIASNKQKSPFKQFAHPPRKVAKMLFGVQN